MMDMGFMELLLILLVGLLVFGPETLPDAIRAAYRWYLQLSRWLTETKDDLTSQLRSDEIVESFKKDKEQLAELDKAVRSTHLDLLDSFDKQKPGEGQT